MAATVRQIEFKLLRFRRTRVVLCRRSELELHIAQPERICNYGDRAEGHRGARNHRA